MTKKYLGVEAVNDLFDILDENYVSKEEIAERDKAITNAINIGSLLITAGILKMAEAVSSVKATMEGEKVNDSEVASDSDVNDIIDKYFND